jgi:hypothetical protein
MRFSMIATLVLGSLVTYACSDDTSSQTPGPQDASVDAVTADGPVVDAGPRAVELKFEGRVGTEIFACGKTFTGVGTSNASATAADMRFFVHDVRLLKAGGEEVKVTLDVAEPWQNARLALIDFEDKSGDCEFGTAGRPAAHRIVHAGAQRAGHDLHGVCVVVDRDLARRLLVDRGQRRRGLGRGRGEREEEESGPQLQPHPLVTSVVPPAAPSWTAST